MWRLTGTLNLSRCLLPVPVHLDGPAWPGLHMQQRRSGWPPAWVIIFWIPSEIGIVWETLGSYKIPRFAILWAPFLMGWCLIGCYPMRRPWNFCFATLKFQIFPSKYNWNLKVGSFTANNIVKINFGATVAQYATLDTTGGFVLKKWSCVYRSPALLLAAPSWNKGS